MMDKYEIKKIAEYVVTVLDKLTKPKTLKMFCDWFLDDGRSIFDEIQLNKKFYKKSEEGEIVIEDIQKFLNDLQKQIKGKYVNQPLKLSFVEQTLIYVKKAISLDEREKEVLGFLVRENANRSLECFMDRMEKWSNGDEIVACKGVTQKEYIQIRNHLRELGLTEYAQYQNDDDLTYFTRELFSRNYKNYTDFVQCVIGKYEKTSLCWKDFSYLENIDYVADLIKSAMQNHEKGVNFLFYGVPGTGKTEFAKVIAKKIKAKCFSIGEECMSSGDSEKSIDYRFFKFNFMQKMLEHKNDTFLIMDEAEDIFFQGSLKKIQVNRLLENNQLPVIWITNRTMGVDNAFLRRFSMAIPFKELDDDIKVKIWSKSFSKNGVEVEEKKIKSLVHEYQVPVSFIASATRNAKITGKGIDIVEASLKSMQTLCFGETDKQAEYTGVIDFDPELLNTDTDLKKLSDQLLEKGKKNFSLCLYGVSGTGKSAYGVWLAKKLGMKTIKIRCSDIMDKYVGETEQNIKKAFAQAKREKAVLIFDEADSFLQDRTFAQHNWEVTGVNEMLTQMENHPYPFICTTNLLNKLDKASLRRFTFKVKYDYMTQMQSQKAFKSFFKISDIQLNGLDKLTPADFANAWKKADFMDVTDKDELVKLVKAEQDVREPVKYKLGF